MHPKFKQIAPLLLIVIVLGVGGWLLSRQPAVNSWGSSLWQKITHSTGSQAADSLAGSLTTSGSIEATQVTITSEVGGRLLQVLAEEGQAVQEGQVLVRFSDSLLQAQLGQAEAQLKLARANYDLVAAGPQNEQRQNTIAAAQLELVSAQQARADLDEYAALARAQAQQAVAAADKALDKANDRLESITSAARQTDIDAAQATVIMAKDRLDKANKNYEPYEKKPEDNLMRAVLLSKVAAAQKAYDDAVTRLNNLLGTANSYELALAQADQALAQAQLDQARIEYEKVEGGPDSDAIALAEARLASAQARLAAAQANPTTQEQLNVAQGQIEVAQAAVAVLQAQMDKLIIKAPSAGIVLSRSVEPGETVLAGTNLLTIARLDRLNITVYVPEDRYGTISLGQQAQISVDSFPGVIFTASVSYIANEAEFTPRNVQTTEGRRTTVFAVRLAVENQAGKLKPGMPVDVKFGK